MRGSLRSAPTPIMYIVTPKLAALNDSLRACASPLDPVGQHVFCPSVKTIRFHAWAGMPCATNSSFAILMAAPQFVLPEESIVLRSAWGLMYISSPFGG